MCQVITVLEHFEQAERQRAAQEAEWEASRQAMEQSIREYGSVDTRNWSPTVNFPPVDPIYLDVPGPDVYEFGTLVVARAAAANQLDRRYEEGENHCSWLASFLLGLVGNDRTNVAGLRMMFGETDGHPSGTWVLATWRSKKKVEMKDGSMGYKYHAALVNGEVFVHRTDDLNWDKLHLGDNPLRTFSRYEQYLSYSYDVRYHTITP